MKPGPSLGKSILMGRILAFFDFPGLGRASQPRRGEAVARILRTGKA